MTTKEKPQAASTQKPVQTDAGKATQGKKPRRKYYGKHNASNKKGTGASPAAQKNVTAQGNPKPAEAGKAMNNKQSNVGMKNTDGQKPAPKTVQNGEPQKKQLPNQNTNTKSTVNSAPQRARLSATETPRRTPRNTQQGNNIPLHIIPLGGLEEIGKNVTLFECQGDMVMVDCGAIFPDDEMFGVDLVIPDFTYIIENKDKIKGILITHGHEDHIGAIPYLLKKVNLPIYGTKLTLGLISNKLKEHGLLQSAVMHQILPGDKIHLGKFTVEPIHVNHSIPDAVAFALSCPAGVVIATGDYKIDYTPIACGVMDLAKLAEYGEKGVLALLADSTNAERPGFSRSDRTVGAGVSSLFDKAEHKRIIIATFASNIYRIQQILDLAQQRGRKVVVFGRSMVNNTEMAFDLGYLHAKQDLVIPADQMKNYNPEDIVIVTTGSQGEPLAALSRMAAGLHRDVRVGEGDFIIVSATPIPGNEKGVSKVINNLMMLGAEVIYESMYDVHVSGHAYQDEQKLVLSLVKPKYFMPVHGEFRHLKKHALLAEQVGVRPENIIFGSNGDIWRLTKDEAIQESKVPAEGILVDGLGVGDVGSVVLRDRLLLSQDGLLVVVATIDRRTRELLAGPEIFSRGFVYVKESEQLMKEARAVALRAISNAKKEDYQQNYNGLKNHLRERLSQFIYKSTKRNPMILVVIMET